LLVVACLLGPWLAGARRACQPWPAVVPEELNVLIKPLHADSARIAATKVRKWLYDPRLTKVA
jgi:hypothetical protein